MSFKAFEDLLGHGFFAISKCIAASGCTGFAKPADWRVRTAQVSTA